MADAPTPDGQSPGQQGPGKAPRPRPPRRALPSPLAVIVATLGLFLVVLTLLVIQVRNGRDPALGPGPVVQAVAKPGTKAAEEQATTIVSRTSPAPPP